MASDTALLQAKLQQLLEADTARVMQATEELTKFLDNPACVTPLAVFIFSSDSLPVLKKTACVLLRKVIGSHWYSLNDLVKGELKRACLSGLVAVKETQLRRSVLELTAEIGTLTIPDQSYPELLSFLASSLRDPSPDSDVKATALLLFASLAETLLTCPTTSGNALAFFTVVSECLDATNPYPVRAAAVTALPVFPCLWDGFAVGDAAVAFRSKTVPALFSAMEAAVNANDTQTLVSAFETLQDVTERPEEGLTACIPQIMAAALAVGRNEKVEFDIRAMALVLIGRIGMCHPGFVLKNCIADVVTLLVSVCAERECNAYYDDDDATAPRALAATLLSELCDTVEVRTVYSSVTPHLTRLFSSSSIEDRRAGLLIIAAICEPCNEFMRESLGALVQAVLATLSSMPSLAIASFLALHQLVHFLAPDVIAYHSVILPAIFTFAGSPDVTVQRRSCTVLEIFAAGLGEDIIPYVPAVSEALLATASRGALQVRDIALACIASVVESGGKAFMPYVQRTFEVVKAMIATAGNDDTMLARGRAFETVAAVAKLIGKEAFTPFLQPVVQTALKAFEEDGTFAYELQEMLCDFFASLAELYGADFARFIRDVLPFAMGIVENNDEEEGARVDDIDDDDEDGGSVQDEALLKCKGAAFRLMGVIARSTKALFVDYIPTVLAETEPYLGDDDDDLRSCALYARICVLESYASAQARETASYLKVLMDLCLRLVENDPSVTVVDTVVQGFSVICRTVGFKGLAPYSERVVGKIMMLLQRKTACQHMMNEETEDSSNVWHDEEVDLCECLFELLTELAKMLGDKLFGALYNAMRTSLLCMVRKENCHHIRAAVAACFGDFVLNSHISSSVFLDTAMPLLLQCLADQEKNVQQNACFSAGVLLKDAGEAGWKYHMPLLQCLSPIISSNITKESRETQLLMDNIASCLGRVMSNTPAEFPFAQIIPQWLSLLPLKKDFDEMRSVLQSMCVLYIKNNTQTAPFIPNLVQFQEKFVLSVAVFVRSANTHNNKTEEDVKVVREVAALYKQMVQHNPGLTTFIMKSTTAEEQSLLSSIFST